MDQNFLMTIENKNQVGRLPTGGHIYEVSQIKMIPFRSVSNMDNTKLGTAVENFMKLFNADEKGRSTGFYFSYKHDLSFSQ